MKVIKLVGMAHGFGNKVQLNAEVEGKYGLESGFILKKTGIRSRRRWDKELGEDYPASIAAAHAHDLLLGYRIQQREIAAVFGSSNPYGKTLMPSPTHQFAQRLTKHKMVAHINYGCGGYFAAIELMYNWLMAQKEGTRALFVLTDWPSLMVNNYQTEALFSDAFHVSIWSNTDNDPGYVVSDPFSAMADGNIMSLNVTDGMWQMDGSAISKFVKEVPKMITGRMGITLSDYNIVPHQPNVRLLETLEKEYGVPFYSKVVELYGNPTCSGTMIALEQFLKLSTLKPDQASKPTLAMGFGDSLSYGAMVVRS